MASFSPVNLSLTAHCFHDSLFADTHNSEETAYLNIWSNEPGTILATAN